MEEEDARVVAKHLTRGLRRERKEALRYVSVIGWSSLSGGYVPHPPGVGASRSKYGMIANKLSRFGCLEWRHGAWHSTTLGRMVSAVLKVEVIDR